ncbi:DUF2922 domain-containing protein [Mesoaciditoga lauensis]|uniref:DUF2922 domain-containing protein n=1 Tax=Mesoaciditoga lauensis TaxID=1495039 RepID=UPI000567BAB6|nr:DUF2922 domain-containing protein [Mesoaciditoga lauensis]
MAVTTTKYLSMKFVASSDGSSKIIRLADPRDDLTATDVQNFMSSVLSSNLLYTSKGALCDQVDSANIIDRSNNELFNLI